MFDIIHKHYHEGERVENRVTNNTTYIRVVPNDPFCQRCEHRHSYHTTKCGYEKCNCICFISTGSLMLPETKVDDQK